MKILVISTVALGTGGITGVIKNYYSRIDKEKFEIEFVFPKVKEERLIGEFEKWGKVHIIKRSIKTLPQYVWALSKLSKKNKYDLVHVHGNSATMLFEMLGTAIGGIKVRIVHSHSSSCTSMAMHKLLNPVFKKMYTKAFACGEKACAWLFGEGNAIIMKNAVDLGKFGFDNTAREKIRKELGVGDKIVIGHIGNFFECKNHKFLIEVFECLHKKNENSHLVLVGDGELRGEIAELVSQKGLKDAVSFTGVISNSNEFYQAFDAFVLPSLFEGVPLVAVEAQAAGLSCIIADTVSNEVKITDYVKFLSHNDSCDKWADALILAAKENNREEKSKRGKSDLTEAGYDIVKNVEDLEKIYEEMVKV